MERGKQVLMQGEEVQRVISRMAHEIVEKNGGTEDLTLVGIRSGGVDVVQRIAQKIEAHTGKSPAVGIIDIGPFRDDRENKDISSVFPEAPVSIDEETIILVDDVIYTGRTIRAAIDMLARWGKPKRILIAVLVDRGGRELPIKADIVGANVTISDFQRVKVLLRGSDGIDQVIVTSPIATRNRV